MAALAKERERRPGDGEHGGKDRVAKGFWFEPFGWYLAGQRGALGVLHQVNQIALRTVIILAGAIVGGVLLVLLFAGYLTRPLTRVVATMKEIISTNDLSKRVVVEYHDEIGALAQTFNLMVDGLDQAYKEIKKFLLKANISETREKRIKEVFRQYVPLSVINQVMQNQGKVVPSQQEICVLFSHITNFSAVASNIAPDELVESLEPYFRAMVDTVLEREGMVDKYITDAVMAFFGAPVAHDDDELRSVMAAIGMTESLHGVNARRASSGEPPFQVSVGINRGRVTVGTIGTEEKMSYTVIGDPVNFASRLSGLTRVYRQDILFSEQVHRYVRKKLQCRLVDTVAVKGREKGVKIFTSRRNLSKAEMEGWGLHNLGMAEYYERNFSTAADYFRDALKVMPGDNVSAMLLERTLKYEKSPPPEGWDGVEVMTHK